MLQLYEHLWEAKQKEHGCSGNKSAEELRKIFLAGKKKCLMLA